MYVNTNCLEITVEVSCVKYPYSSDISHYWKDNQESIIQFVNASSKGVHGFVFNQFGAPIDGATISVDGIEKPVTTYRYGDYWRMLTPNRVYTITASKSGFLSVSKTITLGSDGFQLDFNMPELTERS